MFKNSVRHLIKKVGFILTHKGSSDKCLNFFIIYIFSHQRNKHSFETKQNIFAPYPDHKQSFVKVANASEWRGMWVEGVPKEIEEMTDKILYSGKMVCSNQEKFNLSEGLE